MYKLVRSVALVGLMGAGKSSVGRKLAELLNAPYADSDDEIAEAAGMSIPEIFQTYGEAEFRGVERRVIARLAQETPTVISTGGGAFMQEEVRRELAQSAVSIWLEVDLETLWRRVADKPGRPLLQTANPKATLSDLLDQRYPVYAEAAVHVRSGRDMTQEQVAAKILQALIEHDSKSPETKTIERIAP